MRPTSMSLNAYHVDNALVPERQIGGTTSLGDTRTISESRRHAIYPIPSPSARPYTTRY
jgi:hypothetical protein